MIIRNAIKCKLCEDIIESKHRHDFVSCKCGSVSVDGGTDYLKRCGEYFEDMTELKVWYALGGRTYSLLGTMKEIQKDKKYEELKKCGLIFNTEKEANNFIKKQGLLGE